MRLYTLDYLRGLAALGIMLYHYLSWTYGHYDSATFMGRVGVYGVSIFYVLSGLTLHVVYRNKMSNWGQVKDFFIKRFFRIYPLLWVATIIGTVLIMYGGDHVGRMKFLLNITGLFGFITPHDSIANGAWSIGNELVFYLAFPLLMLAMRRRVLFIPVIVSLALYVAFAFRWVDKSQSLAENWPVYTNPLNQLFLFVAGFTLGMLNYRNTRMALVMLVAAIALFILWPSIGDLTNIVTDFERIVYTVLSIVICYCFYMLNSKLPLLHKPLSKLGEASYSVYLLHPLVYTVVGYLVDDDVVRAVVCVPVTLGLGYLMYLKVETPFIKIGRVVNGVAGRREVVTV